MKSPIIIALDTDKKSVFELIEKIDPSECKVKVGSQLFTASGPIIIEKLNDLGFDVFLDLKFHDIPNTVKNGLEAIVNLNPYFTTIHITCVDEMQKIANLHKKNVQNLLIGGKVPGEPLFCCIKQTNKG